MTQSKRDMRNCQQMKNKEEHFALGLLDVAPVFTSEQSQIKILTSPKEFLSEIISGIKKSQSRIGLATLYFGADEFPEEADLFRVLQEKLIQSQK